MDRILLRSQPQHGAALDDCSLEEPLRAGHGHQRSYFPSTSRLPENRHQVRVAAEIFDVFAHPVQGGEDIQHSHAAGKSELGTSNLTQVSGAQHIQPVIDAHQYYVIFVGKIDAVVYCSRARTGRESASMQPYHHWPFAPVAQFRGKHVQNEAVFTVFRSSRSTVHNLRRGGPVCKGVAHAFPLHRLCRWHEAVLASRCATVWNTFEDFDIIQRKAPYLARRGCGNDVIGAGRRDDLREKICLGGREQRQRGSPPQKASPIQDRVHILSQNADRANAEQQEYMSLPSRRAEPPGRLLCPRVSRIADPFTESVFVNGRANNLLELNTVLKSIRQGTAGS